MRTHRLICLLALMCLLCTAASALAEDDSPVLEVHGWMLDRVYVDTNQSAVRNLGTGQITQEDGETFFEVERISLSGKLTFADGKVGYGEIYLHPWLPETDPSWLYLESLYLDVPAGDGAFVRIGKGRNLAFGIVPGYGNRKTTNYSPLQEAFTMDRVLGLQYVKKKGPQSFALAVLNAQRPGHRLIGLTADKQIDNGPAALLAVTVPHLTDRDSTTARTGNLQLSSRIGRDIGDLNIGVSGRIGRLDGTDADYLAGKFPTYSGGRDMTRWGADATFKKMPFHLAAQYFEGDTGGIKNDGWEILLGAEPNMECTGIWRDLAPACKGIFVRYGEIDIDVPPALGGVWDTMTWDTKQFAVSYVLPVKLDGFKYLKWVQFEYERNKEEAPSGADEIPNDIFLIEFFSAF